MKSIKNIAIDPDLHLSGVAVAYESKLIICRALPLWELMQMIELVNEHEPLEVLLEFPRNTNTYHAGGKGAALNVGKNQAIAIVLKEFLEAKKINFTLLYPAGYSDFFKNDSFFRTQTGWESRTNSDARAAAAMLFLNDKIKPV